MNEKGFLNDHTVISTVMSNLGFYKALEENGIKSEQVSVGDRYVMEEMVKGGYNLGGEQSGHIIFLDYSTCGDGMLSAIQLVNVMKETDKTLSELANEMKNYPQVLKNIEVTDKERAVSNPRVQDEIDLVRAEMGEHGRVLVRPSGTESLVRVMVEGKTEEQCEEYASRIAKVINDLLGIRR